MFQLQALQWKQKLGLAVLFALGLLTLAVSIGRCITTLGVADSGLSLYEPHRQLYSGSHPIARTHYTGIAAQYGAHRSEDADALSPDIWAFAEFAISITVMACTALHPVVNRVL